MIFPRKQKILKKTFFSVEESFVIFLSFSPLSVRDSRSRVRFGIQHDSHLHFSIVSRPNRISQMFSAQKTEESPKRLKVSKIGYREATREQKEKGRQRKRRERERERLNDGKNNGQLIIANTSSGGARKAA